MNYIEKNGKKIKRQHYPGLREAEQQRGYRKPGEINWSRKQPENIKDYERWLIANNID